MTHKVQSLLSLLRNEVAIVASLTLPLLLRVVPASVDSGTVVKLKEAFHCIFVTPKGLFCHVTKQVGIHEEQGKVHLSPRSHLQLANMLFLSVCLSCSNEGKEKPARRQ